MSTSTRSPSAFRVFGKSNSSKDGTAKSDLNQESQLGSLLIDVICSVLLQIIIRPNFPLLLGDGERETKHPALVLVVVHSCCHAKSCMQLRVCVCVSMMKVRTRFSFLRGPEKETRDCATTAPHRINEEVWFTISLSVVSHFVSGALNMISGAAVHTPSSSLCPLSATASRW